jgi:hypothetical protein
MSGVEESRKFVGLGKKFLVKMKTSQEFKKIYVKKLSFYKRTFRYLDSPIFTEVHEMSL